MNRREFLTFAIASAAVAARGRSASAESPAATDSGWRTFEITTRIQVLHPSGATRVWLPMPLAVASYQKTLGDTYQAPGGRTTMVETDDLDVLVAQWDDGIEPALTITNRVSTTQHSANLATPTVQPPLDMRPFARYLRGTKSLPVEVVKPAADELTRGAGTDVERARALFEAMAGRPAADGIDSGVRFTALARASSIPAREVWGLRVSTPNATRAQHCRCEVYLTGYGWVPVDPTDRQFGSWDSSWIAYNSAHDVVLPGSKRGSLPFLAYPEAETTLGRLDSLNPDAFKYEITASEVT